MCRVFAVALMTVSLIGTVDAASTCFDYSVPPNVYEIDSDVLPGYGRSMALVDDALWVNLHDDCLVRFTITPAGGLEPDVTIPIGPSEEAILKEAGGALILSGWDFEHDTAFLHTFRTEPPYGLRGTVIILNEQFRDMDASGSVAVITTNLSCTMIDLTDLDAPAFVGSVAGDFQGIETDGTWAYDAAGRLIHLEPGVGPSIQLQTAVSNPEEWKDSRLYCQSALWDVANPLAPVLIRDLSPSPCHPVRGSVKKTFGLVGSGFFTRAYPGLWGWTENAVSAGYLWVNPPSVWSTYIRMVGSSNNLYVLESTPASSCITTYRVDSVAGMVPDSTIIMPSAKVWDVDVQDGVISLLRLQLVGVGYGYAFQTTSSFGAAGSCESSSIGPITQAWEFGMGRADVSPDFVAGVDGGTFVARDRQTGEGTDEIYWLGGGTDVRIIGDRAYVTSSIGALHILDISDPPNPVSRGLTITPGGVNEILTNGPYLYLASSTSGVLTYELVTPDIPVLRSSESATTRRDALAFDDNILVATDGSSNSLFVYDLSDPSNPTPLGSVALGVAEVHDVATNGGIAYVNCRTGFAIVDIQSPTSPSLVTVVPTQDEIGGLAVDDDYLYVAIGYNLIPFQRQCPPTITTARGEDRRLRGGAHPNPFVSHTLLPFDAGRAGRLQVDVFDVTGRRVRGWEHTILSAARQTIRWDGLDQAGGRAAAGVYFIRLRTQDRETMHRVVRLR